MLSILLSASSMEDEETASYPFWRRMAARRMSRSGRSSRSKTRIGLVSILFASESDIAMNELQVLQGGGAVFKFPAAGTWMQVSARTSKTILSLPQFLRKSLHARL